VILKPGDDLCGATAVPWRKDWRTRGRSSPSLGAMNSRTYLLTLRLMFIHDDWEEYFRKRITTVAYNYQQTL